MTAAGKYLKLPINRRRLLAEATLYLLSARLQTSLLPFRHIAPTLGTAMQESPDTLPTTQQTVSNDIAWAINRAAYYLPVRLLCLQQGIAAKRMLARREIPATLYLGTYRNGTGALHAHAWLRSGVIDVTGGNDNAEHTVISRFS